MTKSTGHLAFAGAFEFFIGVDGSIYRAPLANPIDPHGYRQGARFESTAASWAHFGPMVLERMRTA